MTQQSNPPNSPAKVPVVQLTTESVIAAYIHEISARHRRVDPTVEEPAAPGPASSASA